MEILTLEEISFKEKINEKFLDSLKLFDFQELFEICKSMDNFFCYLDTYSTSSSEDLSTDDDSIVKYDKKTGSKEKIDNIKKSLGWCLWFLNLLSKYRVKYVHPYHLVFQGDHFLISIMLNITKTLSFHFRLDQVDILLSFYETNNPPKINSKTFDFSVKFSTEILNYINPRLLDSGYIKTPIILKEEEKQLFDFYKDNYKELDKFYDYFTEYITKTLDEKNNENK